MCHWYLTKERASFRKSKEFLSTHRFSHTSIPDMNFCKTEKSYKISWHRVACQDIFILHMHEKMQKGKKILAICMSGMHNKKNCSQAQKCDKMKEMIWEHAKSRNMRHGNEHNEGAAVTYRRFCFEGPEYREYA